MYTVSIECISKCCGNKKTDRAVSTAFSSSPKLSRVSITRWQHVLLFKQYFFTYIGCTQMADRAWLHGDSFCFFFCTRFQCRLLAWRPSFDMPFLNMLCKLAYVTNVGTTGFFTIKFDFYSWKMDLFDIELRLGVSRKYSVRDKLTVLNAYIFRIIYWAIAAQFYRSHRREPIDYTKIVSIIPNTDKRAKSTTYFIHLRPG